MSMLNECIPNEVGKIEKIKECVWSVWSVCGVCVECVECVGRRRRDGGKQPFYARRTLAYGETPAAGSC